MGFIFSILFLICILWAIFYFELSRLMATAIIILASLFAAIFISPWSDPSQNNGQHVPLKIT